METSIEELRAAGLDVRFMSQTNGGEYHAPCPACRKTTGNGGRDRLCIWPAEGRAWCRQCNTSTTIVSLLAELLGISEPQARKRLSVPAGRASARRDVVEDRAAWRAKAKEIVAMGVRHLESDECCTQQDFLLARGLKPKTIALARLTSPTRARRHCSGKPRAC